MMKGGAKYSNMPTIVSLESLFFFFFFFRWRVPFGPVSWHQPSLLPTPLSYIAASYTYTYVLRTACMRGEAKKSFLNPMQESERGFGPALLFGKEEGEDEGMQI